MKVLDDYNAESQEGISRMQQNAADGLRYSASRGYLHNLEVPTLELQTEVLVTRVVIENGRATGVEVRDKDGSTRVVRAGKEVILSAGFVGSAQILMLSGVGHADHLARHGIRCVADLPVGDNLHDHMFHALTFHATSSTMRGNAFFFAKGLVKEVTRGGTFLANSVFESVGFVRTSQATDVPDLQLHLLPWSYVSPNQDAPIRHDVDPRPSITILATLIYPKSRGTLRLASADPTTAPLIDFNYLAEPGGPRGARRGLGDGPRDHGRRRDRRPRQGGDPPGHPASRARTCAGRSSTGPRRSTTASAPAGWASTSARWSAPTSGSAASRACGSPTPRSCRRSPAATPTPRRS